MSYTLSATQVGEYYKVNNLQNLWFIHHNNTYPKKRTLFPIASPQTYANEIRFLLDIFYC